MTNLKDSTGVYDIIRQYNASWSAFADLTLFDEITKKNHDDVAFTGERLVINELVKSAHANVLSQHLIRYDLACRFVAGKKVLDAACGSGFGSKMLEISGAEEIQAIDISAESLRHALRDYAGSRIHYVCGDINHLPYESESFDVVVSFETIEHVSNGSLWICESARMLKPGGLLIVSTPNRDVTNPGLYYGEQPVNPYHCFEYTISEFIGELLPSYDVLELYGQTIIPDHKIHARQAVRGSLGRDLSYVPGFCPDIHGHQLVPLSTLKNAQPIFIVAVCLKK